MQVETEMCALQPTYWQAQTDMQGCYKPWTCVRAGRSGDGRAAASELAGANGHAGLSETLFFCACR